VFSVLLLWETPPHTRRQADLSLHILYIIVISLSQSLITSASTQRYSGGHTHFSIGRYTRLYSWLFQLQ